MEKAGGHEVSERFRVTNHVPGADVTAMLIAQDREVSVRQDQFWCRCPV